MWDRRYIYIQTEDILCIFLNIEGEGPLSKVIKLRY